MKLPARLLLLLGQRANQLIQEAIREGIDADGKRYAYSEKPFVRPAGGPDLLGPQQARLKRAARDGDDISYFRTNEDKLWIRASSYKRFKEIAWGYPGGGPFLQASGRMLQNLRATEPDVNEQAQSVTLGFSDPSQAQKATWLHQGVGKSKKVWKFLGLRPAQRQALASYLQSLPEVTEGIELQIRESLQIAIDEASKGQ